VKLKLWAALILGVLAAGAVAYGWWWFDGRWRPKLITRHAEEISALLDKAGWVSPGGKGRPVYIVCYRGCSDCERYWSQELPKLRQAGADPRLILVARADKDGQPRSSAPERATVAELWFNRSWELLERWMTTAPGEWTAQGIAPADPDAARSAVVAQSRAFAAKLNELLRANGVGAEELRYPTVVWRTKAGEMKACACEDARTYRYVREDLGA
jgi:hypothetical protein